MNVAYVSSEISPYAKTGGLADVAGAVPSALAARGHKVAVIMPYYRKVKAGGFKIKRTDLEVTVPMNGADVSVPIHSARLGKNGTIYFIENPDYFEQSDELYGTSKGDFPNNCERFSFFCKAVPELLRSLGDPVDILHCNDWQTALLPIYLRLWYTNSPLFENTRTVFTIHNMAYQGTFPAAEYAVTGLPQNLFTAEGGIEYYGNFNLLKGGILFADAITAVSPRYSYEIKTAEFGCGLDGVLLKRSARLFGILNGIDVKEWNPATDKRIASNYSIEKMDGKRRCKRALQKICSLPEEQGVPLIGTIGRLTSQKGFDLVGRLIKRLDDLDVQFVLLGKGEKKYHDAFKRLAAKRPDRLSVNLRFDDDLAHQIEAGADMFLMPSRFEPCGLNQMYSLRYGTVPVVRKTGGLADTVVDFSPDGLKNGRSTGFVFDNYSVGALEKTVRAALTLYPDRRKWLKLARNGMSQDWSWKRSAVSYEKLYKGLIKERMSKGGR